MTRAFSISGFGHRIEIVVDIAVRRSAHAATAPVFTASGG
jgi:hypothetical protein